MKDLDDRQARRPVHHIIFRILACLFILAAGIFGMNGLAGMKKSPAAAKNEEPALKVEAIRAQPVDTPVVITGYGEVHALKVVPLSPEVSGTIVAIHPRLVAGGIIPMGETLFRIDTRDYDAAVKEARAAEAQWENTIKRLEKQFAIDRQRLSTLQRNRELAGLEFQRLRSLFQETRSVPAPMWRKPNRSSMRPRTRLTS
jgi:multidrug efflux system membrane fusion protein